MAARERYAVIRDKAAQQALAQRFRQLHDSSRLLVLPNAWDAGSAVIFEKAGFSAIGTTSAGIAYALGYPDGEHIGFEEVLECVKRILKRITTPLSVDLETGYSNDVGQVVENVRQVIELGAVGINIEDGITQPSAGLSDLGKHLELVNAISELRQRLNVPFVINARTDAYWLSLERAETRLALTLERARAYAEAGADCIFVPGKLTREVIETLVKEIAGPLNVIAVPGGPSVHDLETLGVARLSLGSGPVRASLGITQSIANELKSGVFESLSKNALNYETANELFR